MYWEKRDCLGTLVAEVMRRNTFDQIMRLMHFADNSNIENDRFYKVRPLFDHLNKVCLQNDVSKHCRIDEIMMPYYSKQNDKQFIKEIPIRLSYKLCASCSQEGYVKEVFSKNISVVKWRKSKPVACF